MGVESDPPRAPSNSLTDRKNMQFIVQGLLRHMVPAFPSGIGNIILRLRVELLINMVQTSLVELKYYYRPRVSCTSLSILNKMLVMTALYGFDVPLRQV